MFSYYGSKASLVRYYPRPTFKKIREPFAGSARYALEYFENEVILYDKNPDIVKLWNYLISVPEKEIKALPRLTTGETIDNHNYLTRDQKNLLRFLVNAGSASGGKTVTKFVGDIGSALDNIASQLHKIRHWKAYNKSCFEIFSDEKNDECTWFVDPPYQFGGEHYVCSSRDISFKSLAKWCTELKGQVMVCENSKAKWMPFKPLVKNSGLKFDTLEVMWANFNWTPMSIQMELF